MQARQLVGSNIRRLRVSVGLSQEALGLAAGCEPSYVGRIERGHENPGVDLLESIAGVLTVPIAALFEPLKEGTKIARGLTPGPKPRRVDAP